MQKSERVYAVVSFVGVSINPDGAEEGEGVNIPSPCNKCHDCVPASCSVEHEDVCWESRVRVRSFWHKMRMAIFGCDGFKQR